MRPGRLDRILYVGPPDRDGREEIMRIRTKQMQVEKDLDIPQIATLVSNSIYRYNEKTILTLIFTDRRLFWGGNIGSLPRGCITDNAGRYQCAFCKWYPFLPSKYEFDVFAKGIPGGIHCCRKIYTATNYTLDVTKI